MALIIKWGAAPQSLLKAHRRYLQSDRHKPRKSPHQLSDEAPWPRTRFPSPHEILGAQPGLPYTKKHFYRLVKLYHPDLRTLNKTRVVSVSHTTMTERYRLVIEARKILSDPKKRLLYEKYGLGWSEFRQRTQQAPRPSHSTTARSRYDDASFTQKGSPERQFPTYASNSVVAIVFVPMAMAGGIAQLERAQKARWDFQKRDLALQEAISRDLQHLADQLEGKPRDLRILEFLARRELSSWSTLEDPHGGFNPYENVCRH
ncbi:J domain-containing protein 1 [Colletotrichum chrysophilum]|uniref:J domain-containing protein 1 n=1 Tax=Colletotrichum chrysophilum TaxID=1836956 RepID=A0AAD9AU47_9PEZI|nr:J domain-containing protein 1 [Colletotrichum chrysophilum]